MGLSLNCWPSRYMQGQSPTELIGCKRGKAEKVDCLDERNKNLPKQMTSSTT